MTSSSDRLVLYSSWRGLALAILSPALIVGIPVVAMMAKSGNDGRHCCRWDRCCAPVDLASRLSAARRVRPGGHRSGLLPAAHPLALARGCFDWTGRQVSPRRQCGWPCRLCGTQAEVPARRSVRGPCGARSRGRRRPVSGRLAWPFGRNNRASPRLRRIFIGGRDEMVCQWPAGGLRVQSCSSCRARSHSNRSETVSRTTAMRGVRAHVVHPHPLL